MYQRVQTKNVTQGTNSKRFIIIHHTGTAHGTGRNLIKQLQNGTANVSYHYLVESDGTVRKINSDDDILWHAGESEWQGLRDLNRHSIGIEVVGVSQFTAEQKRKVREICVDLMQKYNIPHTNILRHAHIAPGRKTDIHLNFISPLRTREEYQRTFISQTQMTQEQFRLFIQSAMASNSLQHQLAQVHIQDETRRKQIQDALATINRLYRELGLGQ